MTSEPDHPAAPAPRRVLLFHRDASQASTLAAQLASKNLIAHICADAAMATAALYNDPPDLIVIHHDTPPDGGIALARILKDDNVFAHLPILLLVPPRDRQILLEADDYPFDDYLDEDAPAEDFLARASLSILRARRQLDANPLTRLPGNNSIVKELEVRLARRQEFATVYVDLDHFKAFNDRYGFARGDEALKLTARLLVNCVSSGSPKDHYVGHVGGDDFIFLVPAERAEAICQRVIANFDALIASLYDDADRRAGSIRSTDRDGEKQTFPLMSISLAVAVNRNAQFNHPGQISAVAAELKKVVKKKQGSVYFIDRRLYGPTENSPNTRFESHS